MHVLLAQVVTPSHLPWIPTKGAAILHDLVAEPTSNIHAFERPKAVMKRCTSTYISIYLIRTYSRSMPHHSKLDFMVLDFGCPFSIPIPVPSIHSPSCHHDPRIGTVCSHTHAQSHPINFPHLPDTIPWIRRQMTWLCIICDQSTILSVQINSNLARLFTTSPEHDAN